MYFLEALGEFCFGQCRADPVQGELCDSRSSPTRYEYPG